MRRFILQTSLFATGILLLALGLLAVCLTIPAPFLSPDDYNMALLDKLARLENACWHGRRLVLTGGSNLAFSLDSERIERATGMTVVNMGFNAGMGLGYALAEVAPHIRGGDLLVLSPEYGQFSDWNGNFNRIAVTIDVQRKPPTALYRRGMYGLPEQMAEYVKWKTFNLLWGRRVLTDATLRRSGFNSHGDYVGHLGQAARPFAAAHGKDLADLDPAIFTALARFIGEVKRTQPDVKFLVSYPSFEAQSYDNQRPWIDRVAWELAQLDLDVISSPEEYRFETGLFYDSAYHLNAEGRQLRTDRLLRDLARWQAQRREEN